MNARKAAINPNTDAARRARKQKRQPSHTSPRAAGFVVAKGLAACAVDEWAVDANESESRDDHFELVRATVDKAAGQPDALAALQRMIEERITDRAASNECSDACVTLLVSATDAGFLYGIALGLALSKGGTR